MTADEFTEKLLCAFRRYYDICTEGIRPPYSATAEFHSLDSRYFLTRKAVIGESESNEHVYFHKSAGITSEDVRVLSAAIWKAGLEKVRFICTETFLKKDEKSWHDAAGVRKVLSSPVFGTTAMVVAACIMGGLNLSVIWSLMGTAN